MSNSYIYTGETFCFRHHTSYNIDESVHTTHSHNIFEIIYFIEGDATYVVENRRYKLKKGDLIITRPFTHHFIQIDSVCNYERYNILFDPESHNIKSISALDENLDIINLENLPLATSIIRKTDYYFNNLDKDSFEDAISLLIGELFYLISIESVKTRKTPDESSAILSRALHYINENLVSLRGVDEVAKHCFVTESYLYRIFKRELHHSPKKYITEKRLLLAGKRILNGEKPTEIYEQCGFSDYTTFYRNYVSFFRQSPSSKDLLSIAENGFYK